MRQPPGQKAGAAPAFRRRLITQAINDGNPHQQIAKQSKSKDGPNINKHKPKERVKVMIKQGSAPLVTNNNQPEAKGSVLGGIQRKIRLGVLAFLALLLPCSLIAEPVIVSINDTPSGHAVVQVKGAPNGWTIVPDPGDPAVFESGIITLLGVDVFGSINEPDENEIGRAHV